MGSRSLAIACCDGVVPVMMTVEFAIFSIFTRSNRMAAFGGASRTQPCEAGLPRWVMLAKPCVAWPCMSKKMVFGIGALSHSCEWWSASMRLGWNVPLGVSRPIMPVDTGQT